MYRTEEFQRNIKKTKNHFEEQVISLIRNSIITNDQNLIIKMRERVRP